MATGSNASSSAYNMSWRVPAPGPRAKVRSSAGCLPKDVFDAFEKRLVVGAGLFVQFFLRQQAMQFLERVLLFSGQLLRHGNAGNDVEIPLTATVHMRHA